jgi:hypothetical protein
MPQVDNIETRLRGIVFRLEWTEEDVPFQGTGFFISSTGLALTAFHNIPQEVREDPRRLLRGWYQNVLLPFRWALTSESDLQWQRELEIAVLQVDYNALELARVPKLMYLNPRWPRARRARHWNGEPVAVCGYPVHGAADAEFILGSIRQGSPLQDPVVEGERANERGSIALSEEFQRLDREAGGLSGSPLVCRESGKICGVVWAGRNDQGRLYATEFRHLVEEWPAFRKYAGQHHAPVPVWSAAAAAAVVAGLLIWQPWSARKQDSIPPLAVESGLKSRPLEDLRLRILRAAGAGWETVVAGTPFQPGELVRFSLESPADGYLYVFDREQYANGSLGPPLQMYPAATMSGGNRVARGQLLEFPAASDDPPHMQLQKGRADHVGEVLTFLIAPQPLGPTATVAAALPDEADLATPGFTPKVFVHAKGVAITVPVRIGR